VVAKGISEVVSEWWNLNFTFISAGVRSQNPFGDRPIPLSIESIRHILCCMQKRCLTPLLTILLRFLSSSALPHLVAPVRHLSTHPFAPNLILLAHPMSKETGHTTSQADRDGVARLKADLAEKNAADRHGVSSAGSTTSEMIQQVQVDEGANKYVLVRATAPGKENASFFIKSVKGAPYHKDAAEPLIAQLSDYSNVDVLGGGRIYYSTEEKKLSIFGFSYGFGKADHEIGRRLVQQDSRFDGFDITTSDEGY